MNPDRLTSLREWLLIAGLTVVGAVLRFWAFSRLSLTHFDEGIYAFSGLWIVSDEGALGLDPKVIPYAPAGFQILVGLAYLAFGVSDLSAIAVATICGTATIPVVGWLGRRTFGPGAGAVAATFAALAMAHVAFSRKALTDAPFLLVWLVAIALGGRFLEKPGLGRALLLGVAVGLAQNVKYNGWLAGVLILVAAGAGAVAHHEERRPGALFRTFGWGLVAAAVAALVFLPWYRYVATHNDGGYPALLRHHRSYMGGGSTWWSNWNTQMGEAFALSGQRAVRACTWLASWLALGLAVNGLRVFNVRSRRRAFLVFSFVGSGAALYSFQANLAWWVGLVWCSRLFLAPCPSERLIAAWWLVLTILTPLYHPYARLWLPLHAVGWILLGGLVGHLAGFRTFVAVASRGVIAVISCVVLAMVQVWLTAPRAMPWSRVLEPDPAASLRICAFESQRHLRATHATTILVLARRPLSFYLAESNRFPFQNVTGLESLLHPAGPDVRAIVDEAMLIQEGGTASALARLLPYWRQEIACRVHVDPVTLLDIRPQAAFETNPESMLLIFVLTPAPPPETTRQ